MKNWHPIGFTFLLTFGAHAQAACDGDANGDGAVNTIDISYVILRLGDAPEPCTGGDVNNDGSVDSTDISYVILRRDTCEPGGLCACDYGPGFVTYPYEQYETLYEWPLSSLPYDGLISLLSCDEDSVSECQGVVPNMPVGQPDLTYVSQHAVCEAADPDRVIRHGCSYVVLLDWGSAFEEVPDDAEQLTLVFEHVGASASPTGDKGFVAECYFGWLNGAQWDWLTVFGPTGSKIAFDPCASEDRYSRTLTLTDALIDEWYSEVTSTIYGGWYYDETRVLQGLGLDSIRQTNGEDIVIWYRFKHYRETGDGNSCHATLTVTLSWESDTCGPGSISLTTD